MTPPLEIAAALIVATYFALRRAALPRLLFLAAAAWLGEDTMVRFHGFYAYDAGWSVFVDRVPLLVALIWPVVIDSAGELARARVAPRWAPLAGAAVVLADAALIEPIAVHAGLWRWTVPGIFDVPPIGILGWAFFAWGALAWLERGKPRALVILVAPLAAHALAIAAWWAALRWVSAPVPSAAAVALAWCGSLALTAHAGRRRARVPLAVLLRRAPGALFFFALLAMTANGDLALVAWAIAFAPPYLALALGATARVTARA